MKKTKIGWFFTVVWSIFIFILHLLIKLGGYVIGLWFITWLITPKKINTENGELIFLSSPYWLQLKIGEEKIYFWRWMYREEWMTGSGPETCESGWNYRLPSDELLRKHGIK